MKQPECFVKQKRKYWVLNLYKSICGLRLASRAWCIIVRQILTFNGCRQGIVDPYLYLHVKSSGNVSQILVYVGDYLMIG